MQQGGERDVCDRLVILYAAGGGNKWGVGWEVFGEGLAEINNN